MRPAQTAVLRAYNYLKWLNPREDPGWISAQQSAGVATAGQGAENSISCSCIIDGMGLRECLANEADCGQELVRRAGIGKVAVLTSEAMPEGAGMALRTFPVDVGVSQ